MTRHIAASLLLASLANLACAVSPPAGTATPYNDIGQFSMGTGLMQSCVVMQDGQGNALLDTSGKPLRYAVEFSLKNPQLEFHLNTYKAFDTTGGKDCSGSYKAGVFTDNVLVGIPGDALDGKVVKVTMDLLGANLDFRLRTDAQSFGIVRNFTGNSTALDTGNLGAFAGNATYDFTNALPPTIKLKLPSCKDPQGDDNKVVVEKDGSLLFSGTPGTDYTLNTSILPAGDYQLKAYCSDESAIRTIATAAGMAADSRYFAVSSYAPGLLRMKVPTTSSSGGGSGGTGGSTTGQLNFQFDGGTSASDQQLIQQAATFARDFFTTTFGRTLQKFSTVASLSTATGGCGVGGGAAAFTGSQNPTICTGNQGWTVQGPINKQKIVLHEMFHLLQFEVKWLGNNTGTGPHWLTEGSAEYIGWLGIASNSNIAPPLSLATARGCMIKQVADFAGVLPNLDGLVTPQQFTGGPVYQVAMLGVDQLVSGSSVGALLTYGTALGNGTAADGAFVGAFNTSASTFYAQFPSYKAGLAVPATFACGN